MSPEETLRHYERALSAHDLRTAMRVVANDAVFWLSDGTTHAGKEGISAAIREGFEALKGGIFEISSVRWLVRTVATAVSVYRFRWSGVREGRPARGFGRGTTVLLRREGRWLIVHEHHSRGEWSVPAHPERRAVPGERPAAHRGAALAPPAAHPAPRASTSRASGRRDYARRLPRSTKSRISHCAMLALPGNRLGISSRRNQSASSSSASPKRSAPPA